MQIGMIDSGQLTSKNVCVTIATNAVQISSAATSLKWGVLIKAKIGNTGMIYIGNTGGDVTSATGIELDSGEQIFIACSDLSDIWIDSDENEDDVRVLYG